jgi:hypothetical protein
MRTPWTRAPVAKDAAEEVIETAAGEVFGSLTAKALETEASLRTCARAVGLIECGMTELVILLALLRVREDLVGLVDLLEPLLRCFVARINVRMIFPGHLAESLLDLGIRGVLRNAKDLVKIPFCNVELYDFKSNALCQISNHD